MHFDQNVIFIIIAAIVGISRLIARINENARQQDQRKSPPRARPQQTAQPLQRTQPKTDEQKVREFLEALGQPPGSAPPPRVQPRTHIPPRPLAPVQPPPLRRPFSTVLVRTPTEKTKTIFLPQQGGSAPQELKRIIAAPPAPDVNEPGPWVVQEQTASASIASTTLTASPVEQAIPSVRASADAIWKQSLRSSDSVRAAIVLREIFGPPRALQPPEFAV